MNESHPKIQQILNALENFTRLCESQSWVQTATTEDIKSAFKLGHFIEKALNSFKESNCLEDLSNLLEKYHKKQFQKSYSVYYFLTANDVLLTKIFWCENVPDVTLDVATRVYNSFYPKTRLKCCIKDMLMTSNSTIAIKEFVCDNIISTKNIKNQTVLKSWANCISLGNHIVFKNGINSYLSLYKVESSLPLLISILGLQSCSETEILVQNIIIEQILEKMSDRSILTKKFWITLFKTVKPEDILKVCCSRQSFLESLINFMEYLGSMIKTDQRKSFLQWLTDVNCICPEIGSFELFQILTVLVKDSTTKDYVMSRIVDAKEHGNLEFWTKIEKELNY